jgi:hypothetical protein
VKARVVREEIVRQCKRIRKLRPQRDNVIRETIEEVRVRVSLSLCLFVFVSLSMSHLCLCLCCCSVYEL